LTTGFVIVNFARKPVWTASMPAKRVQFDDETWHGLNLLSRDRMDFQELADEAFSDLLKKHGRPTDLKAALRESMKKEDSKKGRSRR
jgi:hypothetical protein